MPTRFDGDRPAPTRRPGTAAPWLAVLLLGWLLVPIPGPSRPLLAQPQIFNKPFSHFSEREPLSEALAGFAAAYGLRAVVSPVLTGTLSGRFELIDPLLFLDGLRSAFGVNWYVVDRGIFFYHDSEWTSRTVRPANATPEAVLNAMAGSGSLSQQLWPKVSGGGLTLSGPKSYVDALEAEAAALDVRGADPRIVMRVFRLRHAQADDFTVTGSDRSVTIPGVATILSNMIRGGAGGRGTTVRPTMPALGGMSSVGSVTASAQTGGEASGEAPPPRVDGQVMADPRMNAVLVSDYEDRMAYYESVIRELDREVHLVEIHAAIVDVNTNFKRELGVNIQGVGTPDDFSIGGDFSADAGAFDVLPKPGEALGGGATISTVYTRGPNFFVARIQALEQDGEARLLGRPSVLTMDNQEATLENTTTYYIEVAGVETVDLFKVDAGTILRVTPHIIEGRDGDPSSIRLNVTIQDSSDTGGSTAASGSMAIPPVKQTRINTQALIQDGQSLLIGGYYFESRQEDSSGTPGLSKIPLLGRLFKSTTDVNAQMERMVLLTPRIIRLGEVQPLPSHVDDDTFSRSPTQPDYEPRTPRPRGGCAAR
jgi:type III secretion protein C